MDVFSEEKIALQLSLFDAVDKNDAAGVRSALLQGADPFFANADALAKAVLRPDAVLGQLMPFLNAAVSVHPNVIASAMHDRKTEIVDLLWGKTDLLEGEGALYLACYCGLWERVLQTYPNLSGVDHGRMLLSLLAYKGPMDTTGIADRLLDMVLQHCSPKDVDDAIWYICHQNDVSCSIRRIFKLLSPKIQAQFFRNCVKSNNTMALSMMAVSEDFNPSDLHPADLIDGLALVIKFEIFNSCVALTKIVTKSMRLNFSLFSALIPTENRDLIQYLWPFFDHTKDISDKIATYATNHPKTMMWLCRNTALDCAHIAAHMASTRTDADVMWLLSQTSADRTLDIMNKNNASSEDIAYIQILAARMQKQAIAAHVFDNAPTAVSRKM